MTDDIHRLAAIGLISNSALARNVLIRRVVIGPLGQHVRTFRHISDRRLEREKLKESVVATPTADNQTGKAREHNNGTPNK
jgi:hypothetical protein